MSAKSKFRVLSKTLQVYEMIHAGKITTMTVALSSNCHADFIILYSVTNFHIFHFTKNLRAFRISFPILRRGESDGLPPTSVLLTITCTQLLSTELA